jgi:hypothetical protein
MKQTNFFTYNLANNSRAKGQFNIYQAKTGKIFLNMGNCVTCLSMKQIQELNINVYDLPEFDYDDFCKAYPKEIYTIPR